MARDEKTRDEKTGPASSRRGPFVLAAIVLVAIGVSFFGTQQDESVLRFGRGAEDARASEGAASHEGARRRRDAGPTGGDAGVPLPAYHAVPDEIADPQLPGPEADPGSFDPGPGEEFMERYQGRSGRLSPHASIHGTRSSVPTRSRMAAPNVLAWIASTIASPGQPVVVHAMVRGAHDEDVRPDAFVVTFYVNDPSDGATTTLAQGDADWTASYTPTSEAHPVGQDGAPPRVSYLVRATGTYEGEAYSRSTTGWFYVHTPGARLDTARASAQQQGTDVVVTVPVAIDRAGAYFGYAELWGAGDAGRPVAFARDRVVLEHPGEGDFTFLFGGAIIRASGIDGPYVVRNMRFMQVDSIPPHEQSPTEEVLTTPAWHATDFQ
jgi:hypothetical protein